MSSQLIGLFRKLTWSDFRGRQPASISDDMKAEAHPSISVTGDSTKAFGKAADQTWGLADTLRVEIKFDTHKSWKLTSVAAMSKSEQDRLLNHEQGHYNLTALLARDMFIELMPFKDGGFSDSASLIQEVKSIRNRYDKIAQPLQDLYDSFMETDHGRSAAKQSRWDGFISTAFTKPRTPPVLSPDGKTYKEEIIKVLKNGGVKVPEVF